MENLLTFLPCYSIIRIENNVGRVTVEIKYDIEKLKSIIDDLCSLTGLAMGIADTEFNYLYSNTKNNGVYCLSIQFTVKGKMACTDCDNRMLARTAEEKRPYEHICHAGLCDTGVPIIKNGIIVGYIVIGRVRMNTDLDEEPRSAWRATDSTCPPCADTTAA